MSNAIFVVPYGMETTMRFVRAAASLPDTRLGILSQEPLEKLPSDLRRKIAAYARIGDALDAASLEQGVREIAPQMGGQVDRLVGILEQLQVPLAQVREKLGIRGMGVGTAQNFRDKARMKDVMRRAEVPCARHGLAANLEEALAFAKQSGFPLVVKPPAGAGAKNTFRVNNEEELKGGVRSMRPSAQQPVLLEEFIQGKEHSFDSVSLNGRHIFHSISRYYPTPLEVMESPWIQWCVFLPREVDTPEFDDIRAAGKRCLDALGMVTGLTHMEWFRRTDGSIAISEVAARPPGAQFTTLMSYAHDLDFYRAWAHLIVHEEFEVPERRYACGAVFLRGQGSGKRGAGQVAAVEGLDELRAELGDLIVEARIPKPGQAQASSYEGEGFVILRHPETAVVEDGLRKLLQSVRVKLS